MIIGIGEHPKKQLEFLREYFKDNPNVVIYPEFFDDKTLLISREYRAYIRKLIRLRNQIKIAVWPDYLYKILSPLKSLDHITWIYPLHKFTDLSFFLKLSDHFNIFLGFPNRPELRDYGLKRFNEIAKEYDLKTWLLGLKPKYLRYLYLFNGCDVTPASMRGLAFRNIMKENLLRNYAEFITLLLKKGDIYPIYTVF